jgi:hypothetical protein
VHCSSTNCALYFGLCACEDNESVFKIEQTVAEDGVGNSAGLLSELTTVIVLIYLK